MTRGCGFVADGIEKPSPETSELDSCNARIFLKVRCTLGFIAAVLSREYVRTGNILQNMNSAYDLFSVGR